jgi:transcriptional regulator with GAF, ATPase, and Fis domain
VLQAYGDQAAVAVMNARLIEENLRRTKDLLEANRKMEVLNAKLRHRVIVKNAQLALAKEDLKERQSQLEERYRFRNIVGRSEAMRRIFFMLERVAATPLPVLLEGESGTGKELIAHAIHFSSPQREARFVSLNCGALTESLLESELFGHTRGSFTGRSWTKKACSSWQTTGRCSSTRSGT